MEELKFSITYQGNDKTTTPIEIDYKKLFDENVVITSYEKDGETWVKMSTRPGRGKQKYAAMAKAAEEKYSWLIDHNKTLEGYKIIRNKMVFDSQIMPLSSSLFEKLNAKEKQLIKKEKASIKAKLDDKKKNISKSGRKPGRPRKGER